MSGFIVDRVFPTFAVRRGDIRWARSVEIPGRFMTHLEDVSLPRLAGIHTLCGIVRDLDEVVVSQSAWHIGCASCRRVSRARSARFQKRP